MGRKITFAPGEYYHLYNRGTEKRDIYLISEDYRRFLSLLYLCNNTSAVHMQTQRKTLTDLWEVRRENTLVDITAYCLMPNHFHLLVREKEEGGVSRFMQKLLTGYTMYFNILRERSGALFQGKYKATHVAEDGYFKYLVAYIHLNPIKLIEPTWKETGIRDKKKAEKYLEEYTHSSYLDYIGKERPEKRIIAPEALLEYGDFADFKTSVTEWLSYQTS